MSDSAEMLEILVANKIVALDLKLRVVAQVLWKEHVLENATTAPAPGSGSNGALGGLSGLVGRGQHVIHAGGGLAMVFSTSGLGQGNESPTSAARAALAASLPPMVCTYRLIGVDGEATEDQVEVGDLTDPDAPQDAATADKAAYEASMEKEYGVTRVITKGRGINVLLGAISSDLSEWLRKIRRDNVRGFSTTNASREDFVNKAAHPALVLLQHCSKISDNRKLMVKARAPTLLLRMLLDVLNAIDEPGAVDTALINQLSGIDTENDDAASSPGDDKTSNCPTAAALQGLIELLASDISAEADKIVAQGETNASKDLFHEMAAGNDEPDDEDASTMVLLLSSLRSTSLSPPLRKIIAKLLPFLTYGETRQSKELASQFVKYVDLEQLYGGDSADTSASINPNDKYLMETFVSAAINLPPVSVCDSLRSELISQGFVSSIANFALKDVPTRPPPWSPALFGKSYFDDYDVKGADFDDEKEMESFESKWRDYFSRNGLATVLRILNSLGTNHAPTQSLIANASSSDEATAKKSGGKSLTLLKVIHWLESTSDKTSAGISLKDLGILSETLLDSLQEGNDDVKRQISALRQTTRERKQELAKERRSRALAKMGSSGAGVAAAAASAGITASSFATMAAALSSSTSSNARGFGAGVPASSAAAQGSSQSSAKPAWMAEMEAMEEETGLTCAVCQEGSTLQPRELLGLYVYIKKVSIPFDKCGGAGDVDGALLLMSLPGLLPVSLRGTDMAKRLYQAAMDAGDGLRSTTYGAETVSAAATIIATRGGSDASNRPSHYTTTVTAGNAIHCTCHAKARTADRNHPKAPKSEWEGASLRNSRVACNAILPLVASRSSKVSLIAVEQALAEHQTIVANMLGSRPKSMMWHTLHDIRLLLLRMAHGELLGADCGGGSLASNSSLLFYMLSTADMFAKDAIHDAPETARHAQVLDSGFLAASEIFNAPDYAGTGSVAQRLKRGYADGAPMAALCCILFHNLCDDKDVGTISAASSDDATKPHPKRRWKVHKDQFLYGLMRCAGRRHACSVATSGCVSSRNTLRRQRSSSFADWDEANENDGPPTSPGSASGSESGTASTAVVSLSALGKRNAPGLNEYAKSLRPMVVLYAILDQLSADFTLNMDDERIEESSQRLVSLIRSCIEAENIQDLINKANITVDHDMLLKEFYRGIETSS